MADVSFVIPAFNEERFLPGTLESIRGFAHPAYEHEVLVADHGSTDQTVAIAAAGGARVIDHPKGNTISELRNAAVGMASGRILVFLDADTTITAEWQAGFPDAVALLEDRPNTITGAGRGVPDAVGWVSRMWFRGFDTKVQWAHLGGGHMIMTRALFDSVGGFPPEIETGEDYELCARVRRLGGEIVVLPKLRALHHGVPGSVTEFFRREVWHGRGEWQATASLWRSKVAAATIAFLALHMSLLLGIALSSRTGTIIAVASALGIAGISMLSSFVKYASQSTAVIAANCLLFYLYFAARAFSLLSVLARRVPRKRTRG